MSEDLIARLKAAHEGWGPWEVAAREHVVNPSGLFPRCQERREEFGRCNLLDHHAGPHHVFGYWWTEDDVRMDVSELTDEEV